MIPLPQTVFLNSIDCFLLIFCRMTGLFVIAPIFGRRNLPVYAKIGFSFLLALILTQTINIQDLQYNDNLWMYAVLVAKEFIVGIVIGYVSYMVFTAIMFAGQIIDTQAGFGIVNVIDPMSNIPVPITANFYFILSMLVFLLVNGHHALIKALFDSFKLIPVGEAAFTPNMMNDVLRIMTGTFILGFKIAGPVVGTILVTDIALGVISKTIPQMNVFVVGMPAKVILGMLTIVITIPVFISILDIVINGVNSEMFNIVQSMVVR